jgi:hypothetical protein
LARALYTLLSGAPPELGAHDIRNEPVKHGRALCSEREQREFGPPGRWKAPHKTVVSKATRIDRRNALR